MVCKCSKVLKFKIWNGFLCGKCYQQIGWYGAYTKESQNFCTEYDSEYDLDQIDTLIKFNDTDS